MTRQTTKEQAASILRLITSAHANEEYFRKAEIVSHDVGYGVDLWVDGQKWRSSDHEIIPPHIDHVPVCVLVVG